VGGVGAVRVRSTLPVRICLIWFASRWKFQTMSTDKKIIKSILHQIISAACAVRQTHLVLAITMRGLLKDINSSHMLHAWLHKKASTRFISGSFL
jgi:hypothetical protein